MYIYIYIHVYIYIYIYTYSNEGFQPFKALGAGGAGYALGNASRDPWALQLAEGFVTLSVGDYY